MTIVTDPAKSDLPGVRLYETVAARAGEWAFMLIQPILAAALLIGLWEAAVRVTNFDPIKLPAPSLVAKTAIEFFPLLFAQAGPTFWASAGGIVFAALLGIVLGTVLSYSKTVMEAIYPTIVFFQLIPKVALAPVFILWFGKDIEATILFSVFIGFFPVLVSTISGLQATDRTYERMGHSLMASRLQIFLRIKFPFALPFIFSGLRIGVTFGIIGVILGEFMAAERGLGYVIMFAASNFETALLLAAILLLLFVGIALFAIVLAIEWLAMSVYRVQ
jgi:ABC-type nitrate/sulfonate/bicarbonate transport system permease component